MTLDEDDIDRIRGINVELSVAEVEQIYLPLSRLLNLYVRASLQLFSVTDRFLGKPTLPVPYVIGIAGSVAVGKSTIARILQELLARWPDHPQVDLVTTDGFLLSNERLTEAGLLDRKGFPESYDRRRLIEFVSALKAGMDELETPVYSHVRYDVQPDQRHVVSKPNIVIVEGLNVLQGGGAGIYVSDFFDFSIYVDADPEDIQRWYIDRFLTLRDTAFREPTSYFRRYADLDDQDADDQARRIWTDVNLRNLVENILPTRERATLVIEKGSDHSVSHVRLRRR